MLWGLMVTNADLYRKLEAIHSDIRHLHTHAITTEEEMTELSDDTTAILSAVDDLLASSDPGALVTALAEIDNLNSQIAVLQASAEDTTAEEAELTRQRDELAADASANAQRLADKTAQIRAVVPATGGGDVPTEG